MVFDALKGYHQCPLHKETQLLTTFITLLGRYKFLRASFGLSFISEHYDRRMYEAFHDLEDFDASWMMSYSMTKILLLRWPMYASFYSNVKNETSL